MTIILILFIAVISFSFGYGLGLKTAMREVQARLLELKTANRKAYYELKRATKTWRKYEQV